MTKYRIFLEQAHYASSTINLRLAAVRGLADEAADSGLLLSPDLAAGIRRVKGAKKQGTRIGNWLTTEQGRALLPRSTAPRAAESAITRWLLSFSGAAWAGPSWLLPNLQTYSSAKNIGCSPT